jgi:hypothetical protein
MFSLDFFIDWLRLRAIASLEGQFNFVEMETREKLVNRSAPKVTLKYYAKTPMSYYCEQSLLRRSLVHTSKPIKIPYKDTLKGLFVVRRLFSFRNFSFFLPEFIFIHQCLKLFFLYF